MKNNGNTYMDDTNSWSRVKRAFKSVDRENLGKLK